MTRAAGFVLLASLAACDPEPTIQYVEVPGPPGEVDPLPVAPPEEAEDVALNVEASRITGPITLNGGAFPLSQYEKGDVAIHGAHPLDVLVLGQTYAQSYAAFVVNGTYGFRYRFDKGGDVVPTNPIAEIFTGRAIAADEAIPVDVGAISVSATLRLNSSDFPVSQYESATFYLQPVGSDALIHLGESHLANAPVKVVPGSYHVIYDHRQGGALPINKRARVLSNVAVTSTVDLKVNVIASTLRTTFTLNGGAFPVSEYNDGNFYLRDEVTGAESLIQNSHEGTTSVVAIDGTYDVIYRHETGTQVPINKAAVIMNDIVHAAGSALVHDVVAVTIGATVRLNGAPFPVSEYDDGNILLFDPQTGTDTVLGNTHSPFAGLMLIPGTYDVLYSHETGDDVPQNVRGKVAEGVAVTNANLNLNVNVVGVRVGANVTLNGAPFPVSEYQDATFLLVGPQSAQEIVVGHSHEQAPSVMVLPGTYDLHYRHDTGDAVPKNRNYRLLAGQAIAQNQTLTKDIQTRFVRLSATLNSAPFPASPLQTARIFARTQDDDDVLMLRTHGVQYTPMLIVGSYQFYYRHTLGTNVPRNHWARVGEATID